MAEHIGCDVSMVRRWLNGQRLPDLHTAAKVEAILVAFDREWDVAVGDRAGRAVLNTIEVLQHARIDALHATRGIES